VNLPRFSPIALLLLMGLVLSLPGVAEVVESVAPGGACSEACTGDSEDGKCPSTCDECACCARAMSAAFVQLALTSVSTRVDADPPSTPTVHPRLFAKDLFHPPRA
jgi:hypothetical protein